MSASRRSTTRPSCLPAVPDFPRRPAGCWPLPAAVASALVVHAAGLGALIAFGYGTPALPAPEAVVEVAMVLESAPPEPALSEPAVSDSPPMLADSEPPASEAAPEPVAPEPIAAVPPPMDAAALPAPALPMPSVPVPPPVRPPPARPPVQHAQRIASAAPRSAPAQPEAATLAPANQEATLEARIRDAVQAAVRYPSAARMMGVTGRARVQFDYRSGAVADPVLAQSSGTPMLDNAALAATRAAHYPPAPAPIEGRLLRLLVWVEFQPG